MYCLKLPLSFAGRYQASGCASRNESVTMKGKTNRFFLFLCSPMIDQLTLVALTSHCFRAQQHQQKRAAYTNEEPGLFFFSCLDQRTTIPYFFFFFFSTGKNLLQIHKNHNDIFVQGIILLLFKINPMTNPSFNFFFFAFFV